jgi:hypothetical protein
VFDPQVSPPLPLDMSGDILSFWKSTVTLDAKPKTASETMADVNRLLLSADSHMTSIDLLNDQTTLSLKEHKDELEKLFNYFTDERCDRLKVKLTKRKRRRELCRLQKKENVENIQNHERKVTKWFIEQQEKHKISQNASVTAFESANLIRKKKFDISYYIQMVKILKELREIRRKKKNKRDHSSFDDEQFTSRCTALETLIGEYAKTV